MTQQIHAELELTDCSAELRLNGIPIPGCPKRRPSFEVSVPVHHLLVSGMNELELFIDLDGKPSESLLPRRSRPRPTSIAVARLVVYETGTIASPENGKVLTTLEYHGAKDETDDAPRVRRVSVDPGKSFGPWAWQKAPVLTLDDITLRDAEAALADVHAALFGGDGQKMYELIKVRWQEMDLAYPGRNDAVDQANHAAWIQSLASDERRRLPLDRERFAFRLTAGGRMIECLNEDFAPSIRYGQEVEPGHWAAGMYPVSLARIGARLAVVR